MNNNVIVTAFFISFILSGDTYACFLLPIIRYCLDTHDTISTFKFDYQKLKKEFTSESLRVHYVSEKKKKKKKKKEMVGTPIFG